MLAIRCELLMGSYQAADPFGAAHNPEWPPHPFRLHAALVHAACERGGQHPDADAIEALTWLEAQAPPSICCAAVPGHRGHATVYVPRNPVSRTELKRDGYGMRLGRQFPTTIPDDPTVTIAWPHAGMPPPVLVELVVRVSWLGSSRSPVACTPVESSPEPTFVPRLRGRTTLRIASAGTTAALIKGRHTFPTPVVADVATYSSASSTSAPETPAVFPHLFIKRVVESVHSVRDTMRITHALRAAVLSIAGDDAPMCLHGHDDAVGHAAYLALADVGHRHANGLVRGVALALPSDAPPDAVQAGQRAFAGVSRVTLGRGVARLMLDDDLALATVQPERWAGPASTWRTVTPVILDRFPKRASVADELLRTIERAGLPTPSDITLEPGPSVTAGALSGSLQGSLPPGPRVHATVTFAQSVRGPVLAGRGRFRGIGLFLPTPMDPR